MGVVDRKLLELYLRREVVRDDADWKVACLISAHVALFVVYAYSLASLFIRIKNRFFSY
jgi:hypothetical protein